MKAFETSEQDGGLWLITQHDGEITLGYVWNEGYMPEDRKGLPYRACLDWDSCVPAGLIGEAKTFMGAVAMLFAHAKRDEVKWMKVGDAWVGRIGDDKYWITSDTKGHFHIADECGGVWGDFWSLDAAMAEVKAHCARG